MDDDARRLGHWVDLVDHLLRCPGPAFPHAWVREELASTFGTNASWNWVDADYNCGFEMLEQPAGWPSPEEHDMWVHEAMREHPLMRWFVRTGSAAAARHTRNHVGHRPVPAPLRDATVSMTGGHHEVESGS